MECKLRKWSMDDVPYLAEILNNKKILNNLRDGLPFPYTQEDAYAFIEIMLDADKRTIYAFEITIDYTVVVSIGAFRKDNIHSQTAEIGYYVSESYWGKGIGTNAVKQICKYIFTNTDIIRIFAEPFAYNESSCRILEKAGFKYEGTLRKNAVKNGIILDMKMYSIIN